MKAREALKISVENNNIVALTKIRYAAKKGYTQCTFNSRDNVKYKNLEALGYKVGEPYETHGAGWCRIVSWGKIKEDVV